MHESSATVHQSTQMALSHPLLLCKALRSYVDHLSLYTQIMSCMCSKTAKSNVTYCACIHRVTHPRLYDRCRRVDICSNEEPSALPALQLLAAHPADANRQALCEIVWEADLEQCFGIATVAHV